MNTLARYLSRQILARLLFVLFAILSLVISFDLLDRTEKVLRASDGDFWGLVNYAMLRMPGLAVDLLPIATLLGALLAIAGTLRHRELVAAWNTGVSPGMLMAWLLPLALSLGAAHAILSEAAQPPAARALAALGFGDRREGLLNAGADGPLWLREGADVIRILPTGAASGEPRVSIFRLADDGTLRERLDAKHLEPTSGGVVLRDVVRRAVGSETVERLQRLTYDDGLDPGYLRLLSTDARDLSLRDLVKVLAHGKTGSRPRSLYLTWALSRAISPFGPALMIMLVLALVRRTRSIARLMLTAGAVGFGFVLLDRAVIALGEVDAIPPWLGVPAPSLVLLGVILWLGFFPGRAAVSRRRSTPRAAVSARSARAHRAGCGSGASPRAAAPR